MWPRLTLQSFLRTILIHLPQSFVHSSSCHGCVHSKNLQWLNQQTLIKCMFMSRIGPRSQEDKNKEAKSWPWRTHPTEERDLQTLGHCSMRGSDRVRVNLEAKGQIRPAQAMSCLWAGPLLCLSLYHVPQCLDQPVQMHKKCA